jgi:O-antigen/teichoic acid export membrane protein
MKNKTLFRNTFYLYIRMFVQMIISLYTARVILTTLGISDFGIYGVVGGAVALLHVVSGTLRNATSRFITYEVGAGSEDSINQVFSMSILYYFIFIIIIIGLGETIGLWFVTSKLSFPENRIDAVFWVYQMSLFVFCIEMIKVPFESVIISFEKFNFFALVGVLESVLRLISVFLLTNLLQDKLISYSILILFVSVIIFIIFFFYAKKITKSANFKFFWSNKKAKQIFSFTSWSILGSVAHVGSSQGVNVLINMFLGVSVNAAVSISNQLNGVIYRFVSNFQVAFDPQITKSIAKGETKETFALIYQTTKISFYLLLILSIPFFFTISFILKLWLGTVPLYTESFIKIILIFSLVDSLASPLYIASLALGQIKWYQIGISLIVLLNFPISLFILWSNLSPIWIFITKVILNATAYVFRILYLGKRMKFPVRTYLKNVVFKLILVSFLSILSAFILSKEFNLFIVYGIIPFVILTTTITIISIYLIGLDRSEKFFLIQFLKRRLTKSKINA